jgi:hypothetical protein
MSNREIKLKSVTNKYSGDFNSGNSGLELRAYKLGLEITELQKKI